MPCWLPAGTGKAGSDEAGLASACRREVEMMKSSRNKTIDLTVEEGTEYLERCLKWARETGLSLADTEDRIILGDAFDVLPMLPKGCVDLLIVDPPYNLRKEYHGSTFQRMGEADYGAFTRRWLQLCLPLLKKTATVYVCCDWRTSMIVGPILEEKLTLRNRISWQREKGRGAQSNWKNGMEDIWFATVSRNPRGYVFHVDAVRQRRQVIAPYRQKGAPKDWEETLEGKFRDTCPTNFWDDISVPYWSMAENTAHPAQKPEKLLAKLILASSSEGDLVLDPFLGSGSTAVTAAKLGRHFIGIEENPRYCVWAQKRLEMAAEDPIIQGYADGVFWERNTAKWQKQRRSQTREQSSDLQNEHPGRQYGRPSMQDPTPGVQTEVPQVCQRGGSEDERRQEGRRNRE